MYPGYEPKYFSWLVVTKTFVENHYSRHVAVLAGKQYRVIFIAIFVMISCFSLFTSNIQQYNTYIMSIYFLYNFFYIFVILAVVLVSRWLSKLKVIKLILTYIGINTKNCVSNDSMAARVTRKADHGQAHLYMANYVRWESAKFKLLCQIFARKYSYRSIYMWTHVHLWKSLAACMQS